MPVYLITYVLLFWVPDIFIGLYVFRRINQAQKKAAWIAIGIMTVLTFIMEYVYLGLDIWTFSEKIDPLIGVWLWGVPIEEFVFWFGASPLFLFLYLTFDHLFPKRKHT